MFPRLVPIGALSAVLAFTVAAGCAAFVPGHMALWSAIVALVVLGAITPMILAINVRIVPVFSRRAWQQPRMMAAALVLAIAGGWITFLGRAVPLGWLETAGTVLALGGGLCFMISIMRLFRSEPVTNVGPPLPHPEQALADKVGVGFTRQAGMYLIVGLAIGLMLRFWTPGHGRWELVWAHSMLLGWFLNMASGVCYHTLSRWTGRPWRSPRMITLHLRITTVALPLMIVALAIDNRTLFAVAGVAQAVMLLLFVANVAPMLVGLPLVSRIGTLAACTALSTGVLLGGWFAIDPTAGYRLRIAHGSINLFGFSGLLVAGVGYYLLPRFMGQALRWPRLAIAQIIIQIAGVVILALGWWWRQRGGDGGSIVIMIGGLTTMASLMLCATILAATFRKKVRGTVSAMTLKPSARPAR
ncbi:MAG TPA: hypothetical protein PLR44_10190 [Thermomicrobiales bacterium]|jgi:hypothetical protein|nr:hypothetical protein [Chloroflexota bacterium]HBY46853.1 hypothetical protein [Chloroflexota bacterium]HCG28618.1 hypothetical protein [Chloroflexota bacterium]HQZ90405.1 hypothetical protein [Thermomicrobiales bacterium]HRA31947.1 hypothetical protein [Thermomicrobiales bacterium]